MLVAVPERAPPRLAGDRRIRCAEDYLVLSVEKVLRIAWEDDSGVEAGMCIELGRRPLPNATICALDALAARCRTVRKSA